MGDPGSDLSKNRHVELGRDQDAAEFVGRVKPEAKVRDRAERYTGELCTMTSFFAC